MALYPGTVFPGGPNAYPSHVQPTGEEQIPPAPVYPVFTYPDVTRRPEWSFIIGPARGGLTRELPFVRNRKCSFKLEENSEASFEIDGGDAGAHEIVELSTDLHVFRSRERGGPRVQLYRGRVGSTSDRLDSSGHSVTVPTLDYRALLGRRVLSSGSIQEWTNLDPAQIAMNLITEAQKKVGGDMGIVAGPGVAAGTGTTTTAKFVLGDIIGDKIKEMATREPGFDWDITPTGEATFQFDVWAPTRGTDKGVIMAWPTNLASVQRTVDATAYANFVRVTGRAPEGTDQVEPAIQERSASDIVARPEGRWDAVFGTEITTLLGLQERANYLINNQQMIVPSYTCQLQPNYWDGPDHIWLGDMVRLIVFSGRLAIDIKTQVYQIDVDIDSSGNEAVSMTFGALPPDYRRTFTDTDKRLSALERR